MKKKKSEGAKIDANAWMVTFSDLLTLMLTFFVLLLTMSAVDPREVREVFSIFDSLYYGEGDPEVQDIESYGLMDARGRNPHEGAQNAGLVKLPFKYVSARKLSKDADELELLLIKLAEDAETKFTDFSEEEADELKNIWVKKKPEGINIYLPESLFFKQGSVVMNPHSTAILKLLGKWVQKTPYLIKIEGHSDNWELSVGRATNVMRYFIENKFVKDPKKIQAFGYSEFQPLAPNDSLENRKKNRRVEILFKRPKA